MNDTVISVENLSKSYILNHQGARERYTALRDVLVQQARSIGKSAKRILGGRNSDASQFSEEFWALKDISFDVKRGEVLGIIGRNGAGKSTLLKVLSRITEPTKGRVSIRGRVASLLEVGTGFHPELTGRENIYLNGAILGMSRKEITSRFDEIVGFAEVERFLDTPVKRYSSGMYVRLAFAVAAHLEPETLVIDEVLAVGDAEFQRKCLGKMSDVAASGRTIFFVSHNIAAITTLCSRALLLEKGCLLRDGPPDEIAKAYMAQSTCTSKYESKNPKSIGFQFASLSVLYEDLLQRIQIECEIVSDRKMEVAIDLRVSDFLGTPICYSTIGGLTQNDLLTLLPGTTQVVLNYDIDGLAIGSYRLGLDLTVPGSHYIDVNDNCLTFEIHENQLSKRGQRIQQRWNKGSMEILGNLSVSSTAKQLVKVV